MLIKVQGIVAGSFQGNDGREVTYRHVHYTAPLAEAREGGTSRGFSASVEKRVPDEVWSQLVKIEAFPCLVDVDMELAMSGLGRAVTTWKALRIAKPGARPAGA